MRTCRNCGCGDLRACLYEDTSSRFACFWVEADLCSFCALLYPVPGREEIQVRGLDQVLVAGGVL